jgi:hypothetical protein
MDKRSSSVMFAFSGILCNLQSNMRLILSSFTGMWSYFRRMWYVKVSNISADVFSVPLLSYMWWTYVAPDASAPVNGSVKTVLHPESCLIPRCLKILPDVAHCLIVLFLPLVSSVLCPLFHGGSYHVSR